MLKIYILDLHDFSKATCNSILSTIARYVVKLVASADLQLPLKDVQIKQTAFGKPYLDGHPEWQFNIAHSFEILVIAVSDTSVGVDIEKLLEADLRIAKSFFSHQEYKYILDRMCQKNQRFYEVWTKKEAYLKLIGKGFTVALNSFDVFEVCSYFLSFTTHGYILTVCQAEKHEDIQLNYYTDIEALLDDLLIYKDK